MDFLADMQVYFKGERDLYWVMLPFGLAMFALAYYLWLHYKTGFGFAFLISALVFGLALVSAGAFIGLKGERDLHRNTRSFTEQHSVFVESEQRRMRGVNRLWVFLKLVWLALIVVSAALIFFAKSDVVVAVSLGLLLAASIFMVVDSLAERRAKIYQASLDAHAERGS